MARKSPQQPDSAAQVYSIVAGLFLLAVGILGLIFASVGFGSAGSAADQPEFLIWNVSGWTTILWIAMGALGLASAVWLPGARTYAIFAGVVFAVLAVWGFIDGNNVASIFAAGTTDNITHAILGGAGLIAGLLPSDKQRPVEPAGTDHDRSGRFRRGAEIVGGSRDRVRH